MAKSDSVYNDDFDRHNRGGGGDDHFTRKDIKSLQDKIDLLFNDRTTHSQINYVGEQARGEPGFINEVEGLEGQQDVSYINANGTWFKKEPTYQYQQREQGSYQYQPKDQAPYQYQQRGQGNFQNKPQYQGNYQQKPVYNNQQGGYQGNTNFPPGFTNKGNQFLHKPKLYLLLLLHKKVVLRLC